MLFITIDKGKVTSVATKYVQDSLHLGRYESREHAERVAKAAEEFLGIPFLVSVDTYVSNPLERYDVFKAPSLGEQISTGFNGDYRPCGIIQSISKDFREIRSSEGMVFRRKAESESWVSQGIWYMVKGHRNEDNPHF